jgi:predicted dienelactone hydrolase
MGTTTSVEITFLASRRESLAGDPLAPEGVVHLPDATLRPFSGWIDLVGALEHAHDTAPGLPVPSGPYRVGRTALDLVDRRRLDPYARRSGTPRTLPVWVWYPAADHGAARQASYMPGLWRLDTALFGIRAGRVRIHARDGVSPADVGDGDGFPLVVLSPSVNPPLSYAGLVEEIVSHGYIVAGVAHTYATLPLTVPVRAWPRLFRSRAIGAALSEPGSRPYADDLAERGAAVRVMADDLAFVAGELCGRRGAPWGRLDAASWTALGHSFGGAAAAMATRNDASCVAAISLDGGLWEDPSTVTAAGPVLQLFAEHPEYTLTPAEAVDRGLVANEDYARVDRATTVGAWDALHGAASPGYAAVVRHATHTSFQDWPMLPMWRWSPARRALAGVVGPRVWRAVTQAVRAFLDAHARGRTVDVAERLAAAPQLRVGSPESLFTQAPTGRRT